MIDLDFLDYDPDARDQASLASRARVKQGFDDLVAQLQAPIIAAKRARQERQRELLRRDQSIFYDPRPMCERLGYDHCNGACRVRSCPDKAVAREEPGANPSAG